MAALDTVTIPFKDALVSIVLTDGAAATITLGVGQGSLTYAEEARTAVEARNRGRHQSPPVIVETGDGNTSGSITLLVTSLLGNANIHPYEFLTKTGNGSALSPTADGGRHTIQMAVTIDSTVDNGGSQTITFAYCDFASGVSMDTAGTDGLFTLSASFVDYENRPTIT